jgi:hypothetical protein
VPLPPRLPPRLPPKADGPRLMPLLPVEELHVTDQPDKIGYYSGLIEAVFALVQLYVTARMSSVKAIG